MAIQLKNDKVNCIIATVKTGVTVTRGYALAINSSGEVVLADADGTEWTDFPARGFAATDTAAGSKVTVLRKGKLSGFSGLTIGKDVYLSETAGGITQTAPSDTGDCVQKVGWAISATEIVIEIEEHSVHA